ncbi:DUF4328 domain-containing protein [Streptomyces sp. cmx-18-6]|uniref:DUF4328 domain-containing protein n=1 Tax=Streptomyces sp. cmx-18-6 TaxID=2790930 RepID=UPI00397EEBF2
MLCTRCRTRTAVTDDGLRTFCSGTRPPLPDHLKPPVAGPGGWGVGAWPRSPVGLSRTVTALLGVAVATELAAIAAGLHLRGLGNRLVDDGDRAVPGSQGVRAERFSSLAETAQAAVLVATAVVFIVWFHRTRRNAEVFDPGAQKTGPGWSVGGWFVPIANFWIPCRVAHGIWTGSAPTGPEGDRLAVSRAPLHLWWGAWVGAVLFGRFAARTAERAEGPEEIAEAAALVVDSGAVDVAAAVSAVLFVRTLTRMQVERAARRAVPAPAVPVAHR